MKNSCCVDLIGANHIDYDLLIHFGTSCFSDSLQNSINEKILFILPKKKLNLDNFIQTLDKYDKEIPLVVIKFFYFLNTNYS